MTTTSYKAPELDWTSPDLYTAFKRFKTRAEILLRTHFKTEEEEVKRDHVLLWMGDEGIDLYESWGLEDGDITLAVIWQRLEQYVTPKSNSVRARFELHNLRQNSETVDQFLKTCRLKAQECKFQKGTEQEMVRDALVLGLVDDNTRRKCFDIGDALTLDKAYDIAKTSESTARDVKLMKQHPQGATGRGDEPFEGNIGAVRSSGTSNTNRRKRTCYKCGNDWNPDHSKDCPAKGKRCTYCDIPGHFEKQCHKKRRQEKKAKVNDLTAFEEAEEQDKEFIESLTAYHIKMVSSPNCDQKKVVPLSYKGLHFSAKADTGADVNVMDLETWRNIQNHDRNVKLNSSTRFRLTGFDGSERVTKGVANLKISFKNGVTHQVQFQVAEARACLLGRTTLRELRIVQYDESFVDETISETTHLINEYKDVFQGLGRFPGPAYHIQLKEDAIPVVHAPRSVPIHLLKPYKAELDNMLQMDVIRRVEGPTDWVNSIVLNVKKTDTGMKLRVCLDPSDLNKAIKREHCQMRTVDEVMGEIQDSDTFTICDAKKGFWMVELAEDCQELTTFLTPFGRFCFKRLPFGLNISSEVFASKLQEVLQGLPGVTSIADDIFVYAKGDKQHDERLRGLLDRLRDSNIKLNADKLQHKQDSVSFFGHSWTRLGMKADAEKIRAVQLIRVPTNREELQSFLGLASYLSRFVPRFSDKVQHMRQLATASTFHWKDIHQAEFDNVKLALADPEVLRYYRSNEEVTIQVDASGKGLGAVLIQSNRPVYFASRVLTPAEQRYSNIERELLAVVWSLKRFNHYVYGRSVTVHTDHKPLENINKKSISAAPPRLQRLLLRVQHYDYKVKYVSAAGVLLADALSRLGTDTSDTLEVNLIQGDETSLATSVSSTTENEIRQETQLDTESNALIDVLERGWPDKFTETAPILQPFWTFREEISMEGGILYKGSRIIIPKRLRQKLIKQLHEGHLGESKCLLRARQSVFWPGITEQIKNAVRTCEVCQRHASGPEKLPYSPYSVPQECWDRLATDIFTFKSRKFLLIVDYFSKYPIVKEISSENSETIAKHMRSVFVDFGAPREIVSDNGPAFVGPQFKALLDEFRVTHTTSSPTFPKSNGQAERFVRTVKAVFRKCLESGQSPWMGLLHLRTTPIDVNIPAPMEIVLHRPVRSTLPSTNRDIPSSQEIRNRLVRRQEKQTPKQHARRKLISYKVSQQVRYYDVALKIWRPCVIIRPSSHPRSWFVRCPDGSVKRRTEEQLKPKVITDPPQEQPKQAEEGENDEDDETETEAETETDDGTQEPEAAPEENNQRRHSTRKRQPPVWLRDYKT